MGDSVRFLAIELSAEGVRETAESRRVFVPRAEVLALEVRRGIVGWRAVPPATIGGLLIVGATLLACAFTGIIEAGFGTGAAPLTGACVPVLLLGLYVVWFATRSALHLCVRTCRGTRAMLFHGDVCLPSLAEALAGARLRFGYEVTWNFPEPHASSTPYRGAGAWPAFDAHASALAREVPGGDAAPRADAVEQVRELRPAAHVREPRVAPVPQLDGDLDLRARVSMTMR